MASQVRLLADQTRSRLADLGRTVGQAQDHGGFLLVLLERQRQRKIGGRALHEPQTRAVHVDGDQIHRITPSLILPEYAPLAGRDDIGAPGSSRLSGS